MEPLLRLGDERDVTLLRVDAVGEKNHERIKLRYDMIDHYDEKRRILSMGRTTAYPCTVAAMMIGRGRITTKGVVPPEIAIRGAQFREFETELSKRNVKFQRTEARP
jgi:lysine 6-dehydrogenase